MESRKTRLIILIEIYLQNVILFANTVIHILFYRRLCTFLPKKTENTCEYWLTYYNIYYIYTYMVWGGCQILYRTWTLLVITVGHIYIIVL